MATFASDYQAAQSPSTARAYALRGCKNGASGKHGSQSLRGVSMLRSLNSTRMSRWKACYESCCWEDGLQHEFELADAARSRTRACRSRLVAAGARLVGSCHCPDLCGDRIRMLGSFCAPCPATQGSTPTATHSQQRRSEERR